MTHVFYVIAGGTFNDVAPHFSLAAPAFGRVGCQLVPYLTSAFMERGRRNVTVRLLLTRMALGGVERSEEEQLFLLAAGLKDLVTNEDIAMLVAHLTTLPQTRGIVMAAALCDFVPLALDGDMTRRFGKYTHTRLDSKRQYVLALKPAEKIVSRIRETRKDILLVGFKTTAGDAPHDQYLKGLRLLKTASCNLVLANDIRTGHHMVITPEQARYHEGDDRQETLRGLAEMIVLRSELTFTRAKVLEGEPVPWSSPLVPDALRQVVNHCIRRGAYKPFLGATVGHFAVRLEDGAILTSRRKTNFNRLEEVGLVRIEARGANHVVAFGSKPSVGGQSQRIIFTEHPDLDCIVHFHCPIRPESCVPVVSQRPFECGSHQCGKNTSSGLVSFDGLSAVMLDKHGPNVVFSRSANPQTVIDFIEQNFDLEGRTDELPPHLSQRYAQQESAYALA